METVEQRKPPAAASTRLSLLIFFRTTMKVDSHPRLQSGLVCAQDAARASAAVTYNGNQACPNTACG